MSSRTTRILSILCVLALTLGLVPMSALARPAMHGEDAVTVEHVHEDAALSAAADEAAGLMADRVELAPVEPGEQASLLDLQVLTFGGETTSTFFTVKGSTSTSKGSVTYEGKTYGTCLKMESATEISFTATEAATLTLVFVEKSNAKACKVDNVTQTSDANGVVTVSLAAGNHTITKNGTTNLFYVSYGTAHKHNWVKVDAQCVAPTCTEDGVDVFHCDADDCTIADRTDRKKVPALEHDLTTTGAKDATCTEAGSTGTTTCSRCDYREAAAEIPALGHQFGADGKCVRFDVCGTEEDDYTWSETSRENATCTKPGKIVYTADQDPTMTRTETIPALGHNYGSGSSCTVCGASKSSMRRQGGYLESAFVEWGIEPNVTEYEVYIKAASAADSAYVKLDKELVRQYKDGYMRADALGLEPGTYKMKVVPNTGAAIVSEDLVVQAHDRSGFAFDGSQTPGAYNANGTLKAGTNVVYITEENKSTVTLDVDVNGKGVKTTVTGLPGILLAYKKGKDTTPLDIRIVGTVINEYTEFGSKDDYFTPGGNVIAGVDHEGNAIDLNDKEFKGDLELKQCQAPITVEGVGTDATAWGWGVRMCDVNYVEIRNLGFMMCNSHELDNVGIQPTCEYVWVHNNDMFYGVSGKDSDQVKGDGALDTKGGKHVTHSYNHFWDSGKCNLNGLKDDLDWQTYHHNWYDHSDSRHPRIRYSDHVHIYNNYYDGNSKYGVGSTTGSSAFVENNYFRNTKYPMLTSQQGTDVAGGNDGTFSGEAGGMIKAYGNIMMGSKTFVPYSQASGRDFDAYVVSTREEQVPSTITALKGGATYNNFDTTEDNYIKNNNYLLDSAEEGRQKTMALAGRQDGGDFKWTFNNAMDDEADALNENLKRAIAQYKTSMVKVGGGVDARYVTQPTTHTHTYGPWQTVVAAGCDPNTQALVAGREERVCDVCDEDAAGHVEVRTLDGFHSNDGLGVCTVCGYATGNGGGPVLSGNIHAFKFSDFSMPAADKEAVSQTEVTKLYPKSDTDSDPYFTIFGTVQKKTDSKVTKLASIQIAKAGNAGVEFTTTQKAQVFVTFSSVNASSGSGISVLNTEDGEVMPTEDGVLYPTSPNSSTNVTANYILDTPGTYRVTSYDTGTGLDIRIYNITVAENDESTAHSHKWGAWETKREPTCGQEGYKERVCENGGETQTQSIPATGSHTWSSWTSDADSQWESRTCFICGEEESRLLASATVAVTGVTLDMTALSLTAGETADLTATVAPNGATNKEVSWTSSAPTVATVNNTGRVTALAAGTATITVTTADGNKKATCTVTVAAAPSAASGNTFQASSLPSLTKGGADSVPVTDSEMAAIAGGYFTITGSVPKRATKASNNVVGSKDGNEKVASVEIAKEAGSSINFTVGKDVTGAVTATATVQASSTGGVNWSSLRLEKKNGTAWEPVAATITPTAGKFAFYQNSTSVVVTYGTEFRTVTYSDLDKGDYRVVVPVMDAEGAAAGTGKFIMLDGTQKTQADFDALGSGAEDKATKGKYPFNRNTRIKEIVVTETAGAASVAVTEVTLDKSAAALTLDGAKTVQLTATVAPEHATNKAVTWTSSDASVATVSDSGLVTAVAAGTASITASTANGKNAKCIVTVTGGASGGGETDPTDPTDKETWKVTKNLTNLTMNPDVKTVEKGGRFDASLAVKTSSYTLPDKITVRMGGVLLAVSTDYTYNINTGRIVIQAVTGDVTITASGVYKGSSIGGGAPSKRPEEPTEPTIPAEPTTPAEPTVTPATGTPYVDVLDSDWFYTSAKAAYDLGLMKGIDATHFSPTTTTTRAMVATVLFRMNGEKAGDVQGAFSDVASGQWYTQAIDWAASTGVVKGYEDGTFAPDANVTREQLALMLFRYADPTVMDKSDALGGFVDAANVSDWAAEALQWAVKVGILTGKGDSVLDPQGVATRAEVCTMLIRFVNLDK